MDSAPQETTHDLLLAIAGRVDDDLLAWTRELVAVGEDGHAVEMLTASLAADRVALPARVRRRLVELAGSARIELDADAELAPADPDDRTAHRFAAEEPLAGPVAVALMALPARQLQGCRVLLTHRRTAAGSAPGPLPHPVLLVEVEPGTRRPDMLSYQLTVALERSGVPASVEVLTVGAPVPAYHAEALRSARQLRLERGAASDSRAEVTVAVPALPSRRRSERAAPDRNGADRNGADRDRVDRNADRNGAHRNGADVAEAGRAQVRQAGATQPIAAAPPFGVSHSDTPLFDSPTPTPPPADERSVDASGPRLAAVPSVFDESFADDATEADAHAADGAADLRRTGNGRPGSGHDEFGRAESARAELGRAELGRAGSGGDEAGREASGSGRDEYGREAFGDDAGRTAPGRAAFGREDSGRDESGRSEPGRAAFGREDSGRDRSERAEPGRAAFGRQESGDEASGQEDPAGDGSGRDGLWPAEFRPEEFGRQRRGPGHRIADDRPEPRPSPHPKPRPAPVTPITRSAGTGPTPIPLLRRNGRRPLVPVDGDEQRTGPSGDYDPLHDPLSRPLMDPLLDPTPPLTGPIGLVGSTAEQAPSPAEESWSGDWLSGAWAMPGDGTTNGPGNDTEEPAEPEPEPKPRPVRRAPRHRYLRSSDPIEEEPAGAEPARPDVSDVRSPSGAIALPAGPTPPPADNPAPRTGAIPLPPASGAIPLPPAASSAGAQPAAGGAIPLPPAASGSGAIPLPSGTTGGVPQTPTRPAIPLPAGDARDQHDGPPRRPDVDPALGLRPESLARLGEADLDLLAKLQAELRGERRPHTDFAGSGTPDGGLPVGSAATGSWNGAPNGRGYGSNGHNGSNGHGADGYGPGGDNGNGTNGRGHGSNGHGSNGHRNGNGSGHDANGSHNGGQNGTQNGGGSQDAERTGSSRHGTGQRRGPFGRRRAERADPDGDGSPPDIAG